MEQTTPLLSSVVQAGAEVAVVETLANALHELPLKTLYAKPPLEFRAAHSTCPEVYRAQLGAENSELVTFSGLLHIPPLNSVHCKFPFVAVAAQMIFPVPSFVQLGSELTAPARFVHFPHVEPLNALTMSTALPLRTAHTTEPEATWAHDGFPMPVPVPVETKLPQVADAAGHKRRHTDNSNRQDKLRIISLFS